MDKKVIGVNRVIRELSENLGINFERLKWNLRKIKGYAKKAEGIPYDVINTLVFMRKLDDVVVRARDYSQEEIVKRIKKELKGLRR